MHWPMLWLLLFTKILDLYCILTKTHCSCLFLHSSSTLVLYHQRTCPPSQNGGCSGGLASKMEVGSPSSCPELRLAARPTAGHAASTRNQLRPNEVGSRIHDDYSQRGVGGILDVRGDHPSTQARSPSWITMCSLGLLVQEVHEASNGQAIRHVSINISIPCLILTKNIQV